MQGPPDMLQDWTRPHFCVRIPVGFSWTGHQRPEKLPTQTEREQTNSTQKGLLSLGIEPTTVLLEGHSGNPYTSVFSLAHLVISVWAKTPQIPHLSLHPLAFFLGFLSSALCGLRPERLMDGPGL